MKNMKKDEECWPCLAAEIEHSCQNDRQCQISLTFSPCPGVAAVTELIIQQVTTGLGRTLIAGPGQQAVFYIALFFITLEQKKKSDHLRLMWVTLQTVGGNISIPREQFEFLIGNGVNKISGT